MTTTTAASHDGTTPSGWLNESTEEWLLAAFILVAFVIRLSLRLWAGEQRFLGGGDTPYVAIAKTFLGGGGFCVYPARVCALLLPGYPLLIAPLLAVGRLYPGLVIVESAIGCSLVWLTWAIGRELFDRRVGLLAGALTAINPYAIVHDTALQETVVLNAFIAAGVLLLLRSRRPASGGASLLAGLALALANLTSPRTLLFLPAAWIWSAFAAGPTRPVRVRQTALFTVPLILLIGGWTVRNWRVVGAPVLTTDAGQSFWAANNEWTFVAFPARSMDVSASESLARLSFEDQNALRRLDGQDAAQDRLLGRWGREYVAAHPGQIARNAVRKVWSPISGQLSPAQGRVERLAYSLFFVPVHLLAFIGLWRSRKQPRPHALVYGMLLTFVIGSAIFWAHTSHKSYLDPFLFVYAASVVVATVDSLRPLSDRSRAVLEHDAVRSGYR